MAASYLAPFWATVVVGFSTPRNTATAFFISSIVPI
jgi:hypothetical protein